MVYFAQFIPGGAVKIGFSANVEQRLAGLKSYFGSELCLLGVIEGDRDDERRIHEQFGHIRFADTEQFRPTKELAEFIKSDFYVNVNPDGVKPERPLRPVAMIRVYVELAEMVELIARLERISIADAVDKHLMKTAEDRLRRLQSGV